MTAPDAPSQIDAVYRWRETSDNTLQRAKDQALAAFGAERGNVRQAVDYLTAYYNPDGNYAGLNFTGVKPNPDYEVSPTDLFAITSLNVDVGGYAARQILNPGVQRLQISRGLVALPLNLQLEMVNPDLTDGDDQLVRDMEALYYAVRGALKPSADTKNSVPWVTASKILARKRPALFPVRDRVVCDLLGTLRISSFGVDWRVFHRLLTDEEVRRAIDDSKEGFLSRTPDWPIDYERLRILDVVLWMYGIENNYGKR